MEKGRRRRVHIPVQSRSGKGNVQWPSCSAYDQAFDGAHVHDGYIVSGNLFASREPASPDSPIRAKLSAIVDKAREIVERGDWAIVFVQFDEFKQPVAYVLQKCDVNSLQVKGALGQQVTALSVLQKENPDKNDPRVILLKMDDATSPGVNLTTCNHAIIVHP